MTDLGHDPLFGTFVTPRADPAQHAVEHAQLADRLGLDLVTFQDHPYQPSFLDTQTLLAFVAARTERVRVAANVTNLPLRPPAVLARAAASLDRLSGGRVVLGLGAGAFAEAAESMGAPHRSTGERIVALREAIELIRELWDTSARGAVFHQGEQYTLTGAKRGPAPAHPVPIWVGAYQPRMLALVGSHADGWLPSMDYLPDGVASFDEACARIDDAARAAGREPSDVRRVLNVMRVSFDPTASGFLQGPAPVWVDQLVDMVLGHGLGGLILGGDDVGLTTRFAEEVAPAVREAVARERGTARATS